MCSRARETIRQSTHEPKPSHADVPRVTRQERAARLPVSKDAADAKAAGVEGDVQGALVPHAKNDTQPKH